MSANSGGTRVPNAWASENVPAAFSDASDVSKRQRVSRKRDVELVFAQSMEAGNVVAAIVSAVNPPQQLECIQQLNTRKFLVSFTTANAAESFDRLVAPSLRIAGCKPLSKWLGMERKRLRVAFLPCAVDNGDLAEVLNKYGRVIQVTDEVYTDTPVRIKTGTRLVEMEMSSPVPNIISVCGFSVPVTYRGVMLQCRRCLLTGHLKADCNTPFCDRCKSFGHSADECDAPCLKCRSPGHHWRDCAVRSYAFAAASSHPATGPVDLHADAIQPETGIDLLTEECLNVPTDLLISSSPVSERGRDNTMMEVEFDTVTEQNFEKVVCADAARSTNKNDERAVANNSEHVTVTFERADAVSCGGPWETAKTRSRKRGNVSSRPDSLTDINKTAGELIIP